MAGSMKAVKARMKTVANIGKMTKAMKMVAAAKMKKDALRLEMGLPFCQPAIKFMNHLPSDQRAAPKTIMNMGGDKGLCGGVNSSVAKAARRKVNETEAAGQQANLFYVGGKQSAALKRLYKDRFVYGCEGLTAVPGNFAQACAVAHRLDTTEPDKLEIIHNHMVSAIAFDTQQHEVHTKKGVATIDKLDLSKAIDHYSFEPDRVECFEDLHEFYYACTVFRGMLDGQAAEVSSRMNAMENASKNAGSMLEALTLRYNRARQAKITTELCEIISGASAL
jgi:F-type H+-transporting ATPase subunit gamma